MLRQAVMFSVAAMLGSSSIPHILIKLILVNHQKLVKFIWNIVSPVTSSGLTAHLHLRKKLIRLSQGREVLLRNTIFGMPITCNALRPL